MRIVVPLAGSDESFKRNGYAYAKPVIEIDGRPLVEHAFDRLRPLGEQGRFVFVVRRDDDNRYFLRDMLHLLDPNSLVVRTVGASAGAACTVLLAIEHIEPDQELIISNGDQLLEFDVMAAVEDFRKRELDGGTVVFDSVHPRWSFVKTDDSGVIIEAAEKRPISRDATAGFYWFKRGQDFVDAAQRMIKKAASVNGSYFVCPAFNEMVLTQKRLGTYRIEREQYVSLASPQAVEEYEQRLLAEKQRARS